MPRTELQNASMDIYFADTPDEYVSIFVDDPDQEGDTLEHGFETRDKAFKWLEAQEVLYVLNVNVYSEKA